MTRLILQLSALLTVTAFCAFAAEEPVVVDAKAFLHHGAGGGRVSLRGIVVDAFKDTIDDDYVFMVLNCDGNFVYAFIQSDDTAQTLRDLQPFIGRSVVASGKAREVPSYDRVMTRRQLDVGDVSNIRLADDGGSDPFDVPTLPSSTPTLDEVASLGRGKACGTVVCRWQGNKAILYKNKNSSMMVEFRDGVGLPELGAFVEVSGIPVTDLYRLHLIRACWRAADGTPTAIPSPSTVSLRELLHPHSRYIFNCGYYGSNERIEGYLREFVLDETGRRRLLLERDGLTIQIDCSDAQGALGNVEIGSLVSASGICVIDSDFWSPSVPFPKNKSMFIVARSDADIRVVENPPWWTPLRFAVVVAALVGIMALILIWNAALRVLVDRRSREVIRAQRRTMESEMKISERTRLAADLHDSLSQNLTVIGYQVSAARNTLGGKDPATSEYLDTAAKTILSCRTDLRRCLWDLRNNVLDEPSFAEAIRQTVAPIAGEAALSVRFSGPRQHINDAIAHGTLNIVRELVANAVQHGKAKSIQIAGTVDTTRLEVSVRDDGCGFDTANRLGRDDGHFGLDGIIERLERLRGTFDIVSAPGKGALARVTITKREE